MAFEQVTNKVPTSVGTIIVTLKHKPAAGSEPEVKSIRYQVEILDQNGNRIDITHDTGDLAPHLTVEAKQQLLDFMSFIRTKAENEFLP